MPEITEQDKEFVKSLTLERAKDPGTLDLLKNRAMFFWEEDSLSARIFASLLEDKFNNQDMLDLRQDAVLYQKYQDLILEMRAKVIGILKLEEQQEILRNNFLSAYQSNKNIYEDIIESFDYYDEDFALVEAEKITSALNNNQETIGTENIVIAGDTKPVSPQIKFWIKDFNKFAGGMQVSTEKISEYFRQNDNVRKLDEGEKEILSTIIKIVNSMKPPQIITGDLAIAGESPERAAELQKLISKKAVAQSEQAQVLASAAPEDVLEPTDEEIQGRPQATGPAVNPLAGQPSVAIPKPPAPAPTATLAPAGQTLAAPIPSELTKPKKGFFGRRKKQNHGGLQIQDSPAIQSAGRKVVSPQPTVAQPVTAQPTLENSLQTTSENAIKAYPQGGVEYINQLNSSVQARIQADAAAKNNLANNWKQSPLYQKYLQVGQASMQSGRPIQEVLQESGSQLTLEEFEKITALSKALS
ncbi:hypothetical protein ACFL1U_00515 [Patescibacteria group bacterium]